MRARNVRQEQEQESEHNEHPKYIQRLTEEDKIKLERKTRIKCQLHLFQK